MYRRGPYQNLQKSRKQKGKKKKLKKEEKVVLKEKMLLNHP